jgi:thiol-disulfide isomerase/thioredoxin
MKQVHTKIILSLVFWTHIFCSNAQNTLFVHLKDNILLNQQTNDYLYNKIYLLISNPNGIWQKVDSSLLKKDNSFILHKKDNFTKGYYRLAFTEDGLKLGVYRDIILLQSQDTLNIELSYVDFRKELFFEHNIENKALKQGIEFIDAYQNLKTHYRRKISTENLSYLDEKFLTKYQAIERQKINSFDSLQSKIQDFQRSYANTYASQALVSLFSEPMMDKNYPNKYDNRNAFLKENFLKNWNFESELLLTSPFLEMRLYEYLTDYTHIYSFEGIKYSVDNLLQNGKKNPKVFDFLLNYTIKSYLQNGFEQMVNYIYDTYFDACITPITSASEEIKRIEQMKKLQKGLPAPSDTLFTEKNEKIILQNIFKKNNYTLLYFWSSTCTHCQQSMPLLKKIYAEQKDNLQIVGISLDNDKDEWKKYLKQHKITWLNSCDGKTWKGNLAQKYLINRTPLLYIIDKEGKILAQNLHPQELPNFLESVKKL